MVEIFQFVRFERNSFVQAYSQLEGHIKKNLKQARLSRKLNGIIRAYCRESWAVSGRNLRSRRTDLGHQPTQDDHQKQ